MCTVSFLPSPQGFYLAMNRDEKRDRFAALAPAIIQTGSHRAVFPREPTGGTWISVNDAGVCLALINWHRIERKPKNDTLSRGLVVKELAGQSTADEVAASLKRLPLRNLRPFRLIVISPDDRSATEWSWDLRRLTRRDHHWHQQHWFSSSFDERLAEVERAKICASAGVNTTGYSLKRLRQLHCSHAPKRGPFSICMHRADAATVSYTEISVTKNSTSMRYTSGPPCIARLTVTKKLLIA